MELWDIYDVERNKTGRTMERGPVPEGDYHLVVHVCIFNAKGEMLIQQRQSYKEGWPSFRKRKYRRQSGLPRKKFWNYCHRENLSHIIKN